jgi:hypothetical protein
VKTLVFVYGDAPIFRANKIYKLERVGVGPTGQQQCLNKTKKKQHLRTLTNDKQINRQRTGNTKDKMASGIT